MTADAGRGREPDASLRRVQRDAGIVAVVMALGALALMRGRPEGSLGVLAGGALMAVSFRAIRGGVDAAIRRQTGSGSGAGAWAAIRFIGRYGVIALLAWVILVPLQASPLGVFAGVTAPIVAIGIEAVRLTRRR